MNTKYKSSPLSLSHLLFSKSSSWRVLMLAMLIALLGVVAPNAGRAQTRQGLDVEGVQGILAVRSLDGWLLADNQGRNTIAQALVAPGKVSSKRWFYFIPASGQATLLLHRSDSTKFSGVAGRRVEYSNTRDLKVSLRTILAGTQSIAMEYAPETKIPSLTKIDLTTVSMVKNLGVNVVSSADLVQFTKAVWGPEGRLSHYLAVHHMTKLREEAFAFVAAKMSRGEKVYEGDVANLLKEGYRVRGLLGTSSLASGDRSANPEYQNKSGRGREIARDSILVLRMNAAVADSPRPIYASIAWVAYSGKLVPERYVRLFDAVRSARDATVAMISERVSRRRLVKGYEADEKARSEIAKTGMVSRFPHRTGHSLDTSLVGDGAHLDSLKSKDTRALVVGTGFTVGPGIYVPGDFGVQSTIDLYLGMAGVELTTPLQQRITPLL